MDSDFLNPILPVPSILQFHDYYMSQAVISTGLIMQYEMKYEKYMSGATIERFKQKREIGYQSAIEAYIARSENSEGLECMIEGSPNLFGKLHETAYDGQVRFFGYKGDWESGVYLNPSYGDMFVEANRYLHDTPMAYGILIEVLDRSDFGFDTGDGVINLQFCICGKHGGLI